MKNKPVLCCAGVNVSARASLKSRELMLDLDIDHFLEIATQVIKITIRTSGAKGNNFLTSFKQVLYCKYHRASISFIKELWILAYLHICIFPYW